jgi:hypothetical protein
MGISAYEAVSEEAASLSACDPTFSLKDNSSTSNITAS